MHALKPAGMDRLVGPAPLQQVLAYPSDVGLAAASVITGNLMIAPAAPAHRLQPWRRHARPRCCRGCSRAGDVFPALAEAMQTAPVEQARRLFYDTLVFDPATLRTWSRASAPRS